MLTDLRRGAVALAAFTVLVGLAYPLLMFGVGQAAFRGAADGSLVWGADGRVVGSRLIGQSFDAAGSGLDPDISPARPSSRFRGWRPPAGSTRRGCGSGPWCDGTPGAATSASWVSPG